MIDHITLQVRDYAKSKQFYVAALAPLGYQVVMEITREMYPGLPVAITCGLGVKGKPDLWLSPSDTVIATHVALRAKDRAEVDTFHAAAMAAGAKDNGGPGPRTIYHPSYYGAFVLDPDGNNLEAVCHEAP